MERRVDNTCCIVEKVVEDELLGNLNGLRLSIKFDMELEKDASIPFLGCQLRR